MAARYFVGGGTGNWNSTTNWSDTDGGASGFSFPVAGDTVFLTTLSGANTLTINVASACTSMDCTGFTGTLAGASQLTLTGNIIFTAGMTQNWIGGLIISSTATLTSAGKTILFLQLTGNFVYTLTDDWNILGSLVISSAGGGTKTINGNNIYFYSLTASDGTSRIINGTTNLICNAPVTGVISNTSALNNNLEINALGLVTISSLTKYGGSFVTTTSNIIGNSLVANGTVTLNIGNVYFTTISVGTLANLTYLSDVNCIGTMTIEVLSIINVGAFNNKFKNALNVLVGSLVYNGNGTHSVAASMDVINLQFGTAGNSPVINGNTINVAGNLTITNTGNGPSGTTSIVLNGTGTWNHTSTGYIGNNVTINTAGTITLGATLNVRTGSFIYLAGAIINNNTSFTISATCTLALNPIVFVNVTLPTGVSTITLNSAFNWSGTMSAQNNNITFDGTSGFSGGTLSLTSVLTGIRILTLKSGNTYVITGFVVTGSSNAFRYSVVSSTPGTQAILTLSPAGTQNVMYTNATDIDSSAGQTIWSFQQVVSNTLNWGNLNVSNIGGGGTFTFVN